METVRETAHLVKLGIVSGDDPKEFLFFVPNDPSIMVSRGKKSEHRALRS